MLRYSSLFFLFFFSCLSPRGQNKASRTAYQNFYAYAEKMYNAPDANEKTDSLAYNAYNRVIELLKSTNAGNGLLLDSYLKCGILQMAANNNQEALAYFRESVSTWHRAVQLPDSLLFEPYLYTGSIHYNMNALDSAVFYYKKAEVINNHLLSLKESERLYNKLGVLYFQTGDYRKSIPYFEKALYYVENRKPVNHDFVVNYKGNIATAFLKMGEYRRAMTIYHALLQYHINEDGLYFNMAATLLDEEKPAEALQLLRLIKKEIPEKLINLTRAFIKTKQYDSARIYNDLSLAFYQQDENKSSVHFGLALKYKADLLIAWGEIAAGIKAYQSAIIHLSPGFSDTDVALNPSAFSGLQNFSFLFDALTAKGAAFRLMNSSSANLLLSLAAYNSAILLAGYVAHTYSSDDARLFLKNRVNPACSEAVSLAVRLYNQTSNPVYISSAFNYAENNKASVLQAGLQRLELSEIAGLPATLVEEEKKYKSLISKITVQMPLLRDSISLDALQRKLRDTELMLSGVQNKLDENPAYHRLKFNTREVRMEEIKKQLPGKGEAVLSYYYTVKQLHCFYVTAAAAGVVSTPINNDFFTAIANMRAGLQATSGADRKLLNAVSSQLYQVLLQPVMDKIAGNKHLVIIPHNEISYLPFEVLKDPVDGSLLLNRFAISYNYSANFLFDEDAGKPTPYNVLAMAPFTEKSTDDAILPQLPASALEVAGLPGKSITGNSATRALFIRLSATYPVVHLATHAVANDKDPLGGYIEFYGKKTDPDSLHRLYEKEIYNLNLKPARLVILSACETGSGQLVNGEGIVSLSRAFSYAGCKSVITSLWKADDAATAFIMKQLHVYLQKGLSKDIALQKAKIDYLNSPETEDRYKAPSYWAHLVLMGNHNAIVNAGNSWYSVLIVAAILLAIAAFMFVKRKRVQ